MYRYKRVFLIVMDSLGIGAMPDSDKFGDFGVDTLGHIAEKMDSFTIPNLRRLGMANLKAMDKVDPVEIPLAYYAPLREKSNGKDTMTFHYLYRTWFSAGTHQGVGGAYRSPYHWQQGGKWYGNSGRTG